MSAKRFTIIRVWHCTVDPQVMNVWVNQLRDTFPETYESLLDEIAKTYGEVDEETGKVYEDTIVLDPLP